MNILRNSLGRALLIGFAQVAQSKEVRQFMERGKDISAKHMKIFADILMQDDLPAPMTHDAEVTDSTIQTFSDKLIIFHAAALISAGTGNYGVAISANHRRDLALIYTRLMAEIGLYGEDGAKIAIDNGLFEEPPVADNRKELARRH